MKSVGWVLCWTVLSVSSFVKSFSPPSTILRHHHHHAVVLPTRRSSSSWLLRSTTSLGVGKRGWLLLSEDDLAKPPNEKVLDAVEAMGSSRLIASDVASKAGVSLSEAKSSLSALATLTGGDLAVSEDGELIYIFEGSSIKSKLASNSARFRALQFWNKNVWPKLFYTIRVSFGLILLVSIFAIFSTIFFVSTASGGGRDDDDRRGGDRRMGGGYGMGNFMFDMLFPRNYFFYQPYYGYYGRVDPYNTAPINQQYYQEEEEEEPNMLERIFSYIFGDGNPNRGMEAARLKMAAQVIRQNGGAVVAEQLAPFCDVPAYSSTSTTVEESFVLPIVSQLGGEPTVTDDGDIVYVFPELQVSAATTLESAGLPSNATPKQIKDVLNNVYGVSTRGAIEKRDLMKLLEQAEAITPAATGLPPVMLQEKELEFNRNGSGWNLFAGVLGGINLGGALYLGQILSSPALVGYRLPAWYGLVQAGFPLLLGYAVLFNLIPAARFVYNKVQNEQIRERNANRKSWLNRASYRQKLKAASNFAQRLKRVGTADDIVYNTQNDDLKEQKEKADMMDFDKKLKQLQQLDDDKNIFQ